MSVIYGILAAVWGGYVVQPELFDNGPYEYFAEYETLAECQIAKSEKDLCVGEQPSKQFIKTSNVKADTTFQEKLDWVECDYWAGCYLGDK